MRAKWLTTREFARLIEDYYPASAQKIRELCESGQIPPRYAKRPPGRIRSQWRISVRGLRWILSEVFDLSPGEVQEVAENSPLNFKAA